MSKIIEKTVVDKYAPHDTNVDWLDVSGDKPVKKSYVNGKWQVIGGSGSANPGYNVTKQTVTLFNDTVETQQAEGDLYQSIVLNVDFDLVAGETYTIIFDGTSYDVKAIPSPFQEGFVILGEIDNEEDLLFETYPFNIMYGEKEGIKAMALYTTTEGSHVVEIKQEEETVTTTTEFKSAVDSVTGYSIDKGNETLYDGTFETEDVNGAFFGEIIPAITFVEGDTYKVIFNGTEYTCKCYDDDGYLDIGAPYIEEEVPFDWSTYPFNIETYNAGDGQNETVLTTNQESPCTLKIEHLTTSTKTTPAFESMIQGITGGGSEKVITLNDWAISTTDSYLIDVDGNRLNEGVDYTINYVDNPSQYPFIRSINRIVINSNNNVNIDCDKIIVNSLYNKIWTKIPDYITSNKKEVGWIYYNNGNSLECVIQVSGYDPIPG